MVDPLNITRYDLTEAQLEEYLIFWICVAGKTAATIAPAVERILSEHLDRPLCLIRTIGPRMPEVLRQNGIGCYTLKARALTELAQSRLNLRTCTSQELRKIYGIGRKTAKCFVLHSRANAQEAGLDTHVLKALRRHGYKNVPKSTPSSEREYNKWEEVVLEIAKREGKTPAQWDLDEWRRYSRGSKKGSKNDN